ncbi:MAG: 30S ribosomal protein S12 methylthiotransferase RimO [Chloroflexota bacterium]
MTDKSFAVVNLGCPKNEVDAEGLEQVLLRAGYSPAPSPEMADIVVVNTCGFIQAATDESLNTIATLAAGKRQGQLLVAAGCLAQRLGGTLIQQVEAVDAVLGTLRWGEIGELLAAAERGERPVWTGEGPVAPAVPRLARGASAYLKIADGCSAACAFCAIPSIKGSYRSRPEDDIVREARQLAEGGVRELVLIAQDTTFYGRDRGERNALVPLVRRLLDAVPDVPWLRLMYAYPTHVDDDLLSLMAAEPRLLPYADLPLQHAHTDVLRRMGRPTSDPLALVTRMRDAVPGLALRSAFIVGFPGETDEEFGTLLRFLEQARLERVGVFAYSPEADTRAVTLPEQVPSATKARRLDEAMRLQQGISLALNREQIGRVLTVLIEGEAPLVMPARRGRRQSRPRMLTCGRSYRDAPEVDGLVLLESPAQPGEMVQVRVTRALPYDLVGTRLS